MGLLTDLAIKRRSVTILAIVMLVAAGVFTYKTLPVELFPEIEFPLVTIITFYPSANPDAVVQNVTAPFEETITGIEGLDSIQSVSTENRSLILVSFDFGTDMAKAESSIRSSINAVRLPDGVHSPIVGRVNPDAFPVLQLSVTGNTELVEVQEIVESVILPKISGVEGVFKIEITGSVQRQIFVVIDTDRLSDKGISFIQVSRALRENNVTLPGGTIIGDGQVYPIKTTNTLESLDELRALVIGFPRPSGNQFSPDLATQQIPVTLEEVADIKMGSGIASSISRTNGKPSIGVAVIKEPDANTIDVTTGVLNTLDDINELPPDVEIVTISNDGPEIQAQIETLEREAIFGLILAVIVVFAFFLTLRPSALRGVLTTLRPTLVIGMSIPLSIFTAVLLMSWQGLSLNFMTLGGLAISVGRVVDDSIVVLENLHRNVEGGRDRWRAALDATVEVGPAITASTLTTIVVFVPLGFIQGLVGAFFFPFALTVSFALIGSLLVALTAVPVMGAYLLRPGDISERAGEDEELPETNTWLQRIYTPILSWSLGHKAITLVTAIVITAASMGLTVIIPVNLFPSSGDRFLTIEMSLQPGTPAETTLIESESIEDEISRFARVYVTTVGSPSSSFGEDGPSGFNESITFVTLNESAPENIDDILRNNLRSVNGRTVNIRELNSGGPPTAGLEISVTGSSYQDISLVALELLGRLQEIKGVENAISDLSAARDEIIINVNPTQAAIIGLSTQQVAFQINQFFVGQKATQVEINGTPIDVVLMGRRDDITNTNKLSNLIISGPLGSTSLGDVATVTIESGPVSVSRTNGLRSASISGNIISDDTQAVGAKIQEQIDLLRLPSDVEVSNGGVFQQIAEGFQDIFLAMAIGVILVYLVMVGSLGSIRNPFVIVSSLPLALIGVFCALAITGRSLGLPAMMGILLLIGIVVTNAIVLISFVEQLRQRGFNVHDALIQGGRVRLRPILMTAITTSIALLPLAAFVEDEGGIIGAELATVVIGGLISSTFLTLIVVPVVYTLANHNIPHLLQTIVIRMFRLSCSETN